MSRPRLRSQAAGAGGQEPGGWDGEDGPGRRRSRESRAPGGRPREQGGDPALQAGAVRGQSEALPRGEAGAPGAGGKLVPELGALAAQHMGHLPSGSPLAGTRGSRRTAGWGREAGPEGEAEAEAWRPGLAPPQPPPLAAGGRGAAQARADEAGNFPTLPAPAAIVTLTETYPVHRHGNAQPAPGPSSAVSRAVAGHVT